jgi:hypothetical protein
MTVTGAKIPCGNLTDIQEFAADNQSLRGYNHHFRPTITAGVEFWQKKARARGRSWKKSIENASIIFINFGRICFM